MPPNSARPCYNCFGESDSEIDFLQPVGPRTVPGLVWMASPLTSLRRPLRPALFDLQDAPQAVTHNPLSETPLSADAPAANLPQNRAA